MSPECEAAVAAVGNSVAASLRAVDCQAGEATAAAFGRLFAPGGALVPALTIILTLYVAFFAISLLLGRSSLGVKSLTPRFLTLGLVLTFATSWIAYQSVVWNLAVAAPDYLAGLMTGDDGSATITFGDKIDIVFGAVTQATEGQSSDIGAFSPAGMLWLGAMLFLLGTVGVLVTARIALALLIALGPIFVVLALFNGTRGLFTGWLKGVVMLAFAPLLAVLGGSIMLELAVPVLRSLNSNPGEINAQAAMAFFLVGAVHVALMVMVFKVAGTMVAGWQVFGLVSSKEERGIDTTRATPAAAAPALAQAQAAAPQPTTSTQAAIAGARRIDVNASQVPVAANDQAGAPTVTDRTMRVVAGTTVGAGQQVAPMTGAPSRTQGIGNRFRNAETRTNVRSLEKSK